MIEDLIVPHFNYWVYIVLMMIGLYAMIAKNNLIKKLIGMSIFQTAIILFYVSIGVKESSTIPILSHADEVAVHGAQGHAGEDTAVEAGEPTGKRHHDPKMEDPPPFNPDHYANPLPHVLMLTAIVVGVSTLGLALAIAQKIHSEYGTLEEDEILEKIKHGRNG